ncbi:triose-phosphate isomerase [Streptomyces sp. RerS4]|uniref:triose-phosphate isomerase n=1 Tax=Streptomyces sp. RerS4 TaxID=2942449 RepID=UPI00201BC1F5|nr:triose-phosphate isomerase [Streptomyces sp. RerS4]UQX03760.1 triose-phosphate isomerase [Streptomyces sp. RerS4]
MNDDVRNIVLGVIATAVSGGFGWFTRTYLWRRALRRKQAFFGLPSGSDCLFVANRQMGGRESSVHRNDAFALLEISALIKDCGANVQIVTHDEARQGFGERAEFCVGGPTSNARTVAHLATMLPGVRVNVDAEAHADRGAIQVGGETYRWLKGEEDHVLLARLASAEGGRPVFLLSGQTAVSNQAAARYLARHHERLARKYGGDSFCLILKVVNSQAYGPDVTELVADVTRAARTPVAEAA